jgi:mercuric ion binding protein
MIGRVLILCLACLSFTSLAATTQSVTLAVKGMHCGTCPITVRLLLKNQAGVSKVDIDAKGQTANIEFDPTKVTPEALAKAVTDAGYAANIKK